MAGGAEWQRIAVLVLLLPVVPDQTVGPAAGMADDQRVSVAVREVAFRIQVAGQSPPAAPPQAVSTVPTVTWPLTAETPEQRLVVIETLREKVAAANLAGIKAGEKLTPEEEEAAEEAAMLSSQRFGDDTPQAGTPQFVYVAPVTAEQQQKALTEAFAKAKAQAEWLAGAAGAKLGPLAGLSGQASGGLAQQMALAGFVDYRQQQYLRRLMGVSEDGEPEERADEIIAPIPDALACTATVTASFVLQPEGK